MGEIKAILFDLDGVLVAAKEWHYNALNHALNSIADAAIGRHEHLTTLNGWPTRRKLSWLVARKRISEDQIGEIEQEKQRATIRYIMAYCVPDKSKVRMCRQLAEDYQLGCVSNAVYRSVILMLERSDLLPHFKLVQGNEGLEPKPDPAPYLLAMERMGVVAGECIAVEDHLKGVGSAEGAGIKCLHLQYPDVTIERIQEELC